MSDTTDRAPTAWGMPDPWRTVARPFVLDPINYRLEAVQLVVVAAYSAILGGAAGRIWAAVGVSPPFFRRNGQVYLPSDSKFFLLNDFRFALVTLMTGVVLALVLAVASRGHWLGPGTVVGLAVGGVLGALVAAHVGHVVGHHSLVTLLDHWAPGADPKAVGQAIVANDFSVNWKIGVLAWPIGAVGVTLGLVALRGEPPAGR